MQITIHSPGNNWFNRNAISVDGQSIQELNLRAFRISEIEPTFTPPQRMNRHEAERIYYRKGIEGRLISNIINLCEFYNLSIKDIETLVELQTGYGPGWYDELEKYIADYSRFVNDDALRIIAGTIDEIAGFNTGSSLSLVAQSTLYYELGLIYSIDEMIYITPAKRRIVMSRNMSTVKIAELVLFARGKYNRGTFTGKTKVNYKRWFVDAEQA